MSNSDMADYMEDLDILQNEYGKPELVISDVNQVEASHWRESWVYCLCREGGENLQRQGHS